MTESNIAIFVMATYGEGDPTDNAIEFIDWLRNEDNEDDTNVFLIASIVIGSLAALVGGGYYIKKSRTAVYI